MKILLWSVMLVFAAVAARAQSRAKTKSAPAPQLAEAADDQDPGQLEDQAHPPRPPEGGPGRGAPWGRGPGMGHGMGPGGGDPGGMRGALGGPLPLVPTELTEAQEKELLDFVKASDPQLAEHLTADKSGNSPGYKHQLAGLWSMYKDSAERERWSKQARAHKEMRELSAQYRGASDADKPAIKDKLGKAVGDLFDADLAEKTRQIENMERQAAFMKERIAKRRAAKEKVVADRVEQLTGESVEDWQW